MTDMNFEPQKHDPENPGHIMLDQFYRSVLQSVEKATSVTVFNELGDAEKFWVITHGTLVGLLTSLTLLFEGSSSEKWAEFVSRTLSGAAEIAKERAEAAMDIAEALGE